MPRPAKGSEEAKAWGAKMKKAREAKKQMKGGMIDTHTHPDGTVMTGKKHTSSSKIITTDKKPRGEMMKPMTKKKAVKLLAKALSTNIKKNGPIIVRSMKKFLDESNIKGGNNGTLGMIHGDFGLHDGLNPIIYAAIGLGGGTVIIELIGYIADLIDMEDVFPAEIIEDDINQILDGVMPSVNNHIGQLLNTSGRGIKMEGGSIEYNETLLSAVLGVFGFAGLIAVATHVRDRMNQQGRVVPAQIQQILEQGGDTDSETDTSVSQTEVRDVEATGGKIKNPFKSVSKAFSPKKINETFGKIGTAVNPINYAMKNKKVTNLMRQSGQLTDKYLLPAAVSAGLPLYYGAAGTAGMMLGGPVGALAATRAADTLWQEAVVKKGYDPRERQKSKVLGAIAEKVGQAGASQYKAGMSSGKEKKISGGNLFLDMPESVFVELIGNLDITTLVQLLHSLASPQAAARREMIVDRINVLRSQSPPAEKVIPSGASGKGYFLSPGTTFAQPTNKRVGKVLGKGYFLSPGMTVAQPTNKMNKGRHLQGPGMSDTKPTNKMTEGRYLQGPKVNKKDLKRI